MANLSNAQVVDSVMSNRQTQKMMASEVVESRIDDETLEAVLSAAGTAPFHLAAAESHRNDIDNSSLAPWRVTVLRKDACTRLRSHVLSNGDTTKVPDMLAAASALFIVTWCPDPSSDLSLIDDDRPYEATVGNMEHIAATSAFTQNLLLAATARGIATYWSSGGVLKSKGVFRYLDIPADEILLGAVFVFPAEETTGIDVKTGKMRDRKGTVDAWSRWHT
ncbi:MAG: nitroreductase family protein [Pseudomonadota bacterium]